MKLLYVIRHASPIVQPTEPAPLWPLSEAGIEEARALAAIADAWDLRALYSSSERKAEATALVIGESLLLPVHAVEGLEELRFDTFVNNSDDFADAVRNIVENPGISMRGAERAGAAAARFAGAIGIIRPGAFPAAAVSHGRVIAAYLSHALGLDDPFAIWRSIPMPGWARIDVEPPVPKLLSGFEGLPPAR